MSNADYQKAVPSADFATFVKTDVLLGPLDTVIDYTDFNFAESDPIRVGMVAMWDEEICRVETVGIRTFTLKRGCADTVPTPHAAGSIIWIIDTAGSDQVERAASETVAVKIQPFTLGGGEYPIGSAPPNDLEFNWRFFRPYPPAQMKANNAVWYSGAAINDTTGSMNLTWVDRNRITQADQLVGHVDAQIAPEAGTTYTLRIYAADGTTLLRTEPGIRGNSFMYQHSKALHDFGYPSAAVDGIATYCTERDMIESWTRYTIPIHVEPSASPITSVWSDFYQRAIESPYLFNLRQGLTPDGQFAAAMAARPTDRMSDGFNLVRHWVEWVDEDDGNGGTISVPYDRNEVVGTSANQPWFNLEFALPELETILNVGESSLWNGGVRVPDGGFLFGKLALIDDELVSFKSQDGNTYTVGRGVGDTVPARHIAGSRVVLFEAVPFTDPTARSGTVDYRFQPKTFGPLPDPNTLPATNQVQFVGRASKPYPMGQVVVAGRPWFEEAQVTSGAALPISWAWRNRVSQAAFSIDHAYPSLIPEANTQAKLTFFYTTPAASPGAPAVEHVLRTAFVDPVVITEPGGTQFPTDGKYSYPYSFAQADGNVAGAATGVCGTVVIYCRLETIRDGLLSHQGYIIPIRVPSYPCT